MTPPINIDGSTVDAITIDGTEVTEVTADGEVVFGSAIPDSAIHRWQFSAGSGSTATDSIGTNDGTITGAVWVSDAAWQGGATLDFDGTDDHVSLSNIPEVGATNQQFCVTATVELDTTGSQELIWVQSDGNDDRSALMVDSSTLAITSWDGSRRLINEGASGVLSTGTKLRVGGYWDYQTDTGKVYLNGSQQSTTDPGLLNTPRSAGHEIGRDFQTGNVVDGRIDDVIIYDSLLSDSDFQDDYNAQPWS